MVSLKLFVDDVVVVHLSVCAGNSLSSMHHLMMRFEARAQNNTHIGNGKNPCTKVESRWREEREKNVQRAHIFLLCCLMVARKKRKKREKNIYTQYNKRYVWIGWSAWRHIFSDGAHMLINRAHWAKLSERERTRAENYVIPKRAVIVVGLLVYIFIHLNCVLCVRALDRFFLQFSISHGDMQQYRAPSKTYAPNSLLVHSFTRKSVDAMQKQRIEWREKKHAFPWWVKQFRPQREGKYIYIIKKIRRLFLSGISEYA